VIPAHAVPPTATPSPGYEARLQEQRAASARANQPVAPVTKPPRRTKRARWTDPVDADCGLLLSSRRRPGPIRRGRRGWKRKTTTSALNN